jgi:hypothetical protein
VCVAPCLVLGAPDANRGYYDTSKPPEVRPVGWHVAVKLLVFQPTDHELPSHGKAREACRERR